LNCINASIVVRFQTSGLCDLRSFTVAPVAAALVFVLVRVAIAPKGFVSYFISDDKDKGEEG
jgi:hypothetical protein